MVLFSSLVPFNFLKGMLPVFGKIFLGDIA